MIAARKLRPAVKWFGGKSYLARPFLARFPEHRTYVEPFAGGLSVLLNKRPVALEVAADVHPDLVHFYRVLVGRTGEFLARLPAPEPTRDAFQACFAAAAGPAADPVDRAVKFLVRHRMSRTSLGKHLCWADRIRGTRHPEGGTLDLPSSWRSIRELLPTLADRLRDVVILDEPAIGVVRRYDGPRTLTYCDPPYLHSTRTAPDAYRHEMAEADHRDLLDCLRACRGAVALSGYRSALYDDALVGWERHDFDRPNDAGQGPTKQRRTECLWIKPPTP